MGQLILPWFKATNQLTPLTPSSQMEANIHNIRSSPTNKSGENAATTLRRKKPFNFTVCELAEEQPPSYMPPLILRDLVSSVRIRNKSHIQLVDTPKLTFFLHKPLTPLQSRSNASSWYTVALWGSPYAVFSPDKL